MHENKGRVFSNIDLGIGSNIWEFGENEIYDVSAGMEIKKTKYITRLNGNNMAFLVGLYGV